MTQTDIARLAYQNATEDQKAEILEMYPDLLKGEPFEFTEKDINIIGHTRFPFMVGYSMVSKENRLKCIVLNDIYTCEVSKDNETGYTIIKFYKKP